MRNTSLITRNYEGVVITLTTLVTGGGEGKQQPVWSSTNKIDKMGFKTFYHVVTIFILQNFSNLKKVVALFRKKR